MSRRIVTSKLNSIILACINYCNSMFKTNLKFFYPLLIIRFKTNQDVSKKN